MLEHVSFVATATLFWWMVLGAAGANAAGSESSALFVATLPATALGALDDPRRDVVVLAVRAAAPPRCATSRSRARSCGASAAWRSWSRPRALFAGWLAAMDRADARARARTPHAGDRGVAS